MNKIRLLCGGFEDLGEGWMDVNHIGEFVDGGLFAHQHTYLLDDVGRMGTIGMTAQDKTIWSDEEFQ